MLDDVVNVMTNLPLLSLLIWLPILTGTLLILMRRSLSPAGSRQIALGLSIICLGLSCLLLLGFDSQNVEMQWGEKLAWIPSFGLYYALGVDGFSLPLIILTCFMTPLVVLASWRSVQTAIPQYLSSFLIMQGLICGALSALDAILFYIFWESMLIPMFLIIGVWGSKNRIYATMKFFLYTFLGSVLLLVSLIFLHLEALAAGIPLEKSFAILSYHALPLVFETQKWLFVAFFVAFAVKIPMWPLHTWLPDAHVEAPAGGSVVLAAILLKMGGYGFLRFLLPILPDASRAFAWPVISLSLIAIIYIGLVAIVQKDMKKLIAYSSISHMGFVTLGCFLVFPILAQGQHPQNAQLGIEGAMVQMVSHGFVSAALFLCVGMLYDRLHSRLIKDFGGVANVMPLFSVFFLLFAIANIGLPGTSGFVGEFLVVLSAFKVNVWTAILAASILVLGASYTLWMTKRVIFGSLQHSTLATLTDIRGSEVWVLALLALAVLALGIWPSPLLDILHAPTAHLIDNVLQSKL